LQEQIKERLPPMPPERCLAVILDPSTKAFRDHILPDKATREKVIELCKIAHRPVFAAYSAKNTEERDRRLAEESVEKPPSEDEDSTEDTFDPYGAGPTISAGSGAGPSPETLVEEADAEWEKWMDFVPIWHDFLHDKAALIKRPNNQIHMRELLSKFDMMKFYRLQGTKKFPTIAVLARVHFSVMMSSAFQERVFSICAHVQGSVQGQMGNDHFEQKALLCTNAGLIRDGII